VLIHPEPHQHVCLRHDLWLGSLGPGSAGWIKTPGPVDVSALPVIRAAQRRHHRLVRRHGAAATNTAVGTAADTWERGNRFGDRQWARLRVLRPGADNVSFRDPVAHAVCYPEIVTIASVLASPHWQAVASDLFTENTVYTEIIRRMCEGKQPGYLDDGGGIWPTKRHPLRYWAETHQRARRDRDPDEYWDTLTAHLPATPALFDRQR
jgi:hypothetical protein